MSRLKTKRIALAVVAASLVSGLIWLHRRPPPIPTYRITDVGIIPGATNSQGRAINASGEVTGRMFWKGPSQPPYASFVHAFLWRNGQLTDLGALPGYPDSTSCALNNRGQIVGVTEKSGMRPIPHGSVSYETRSAFLFQSGKMTRLPSLPSYPDSGAYAISDSGQIIGAAFPKFSHQGHGFSYNQGVLTDLGLLLTSGSRDARSVVVGINQTGDIVGTATVSTGFDNISHAFLYHNGKMTDLGTLPGYASSSAQAINDQGQITGYVQQDGFDYPLDHHAFLWQNGVMKELGTLPGFKDSVGTAINSRGDIVGDAMSLPRIQNLVHEFLHDHLSIGTSSDELPSRPFLYTAGKMQDLNDTLPANSGWVLESASGINDRGQIVGTGLHHGLRRAFVLTPLGGK